MVGCGVAKDRLYLCDSDGKCYVCRTRACTEDCELPNPNQLVCGYESHDLFRFCKDCRVKHGKMTQFTITREPDATPTKNPRVVSLPYRYIVREYGKRIAAHDTEQEAIDYRD